MTADRVTFGSLVKQYIESHELSYQALVDKLGYKSKTSISRIIQDNTSFQLRTEFFKLFSQNYPMTVDEKDALEFTLHLSRLDEEQQSLFIFFKKLFYSQPDPSSPITSLRLLDSEGTHELHAVLNERSNGAYKVTAVILGVCPSFILHTLYHMLDELSCAISIRHYLFGDDQAELYKNTISSFSSFLFDQRYEIFHMYKEMLPIRIENQFLLHYDRQDGTADDDILLRINQTDFYHYRLSEDSLFQCYQELTALSGFHPTPLKTHEWLWTDRICLEGFITQQRSLLEMELQRVIYCYRKDLSIELIPPPIFKNALQLNYFPNKESMKLFDELTDLQCQRYQNIRTKRSPSYYILSHEALKNFIWTGRLKNHPLLLRAFSPKERAQILTELLLTLKESPFFFLRIAAEDIPPLWDTLTLCGYQQLKRASSHKLSQDEILLLIPALQPASEYVSLTLNHSSIVSSYASFYLDELWQKHTLSSKRSTHIIQLLLQYQAAKFSVKS